MIVYSISHSDGTFYVPTKAEALKEARSVHEAGDDYVSVQALTITRAYRSTRALYCALLNGQSFVSQHEDVWQSY